MAAVRAPMVDQHAGAALDIDPLGQGLVLGCAIVLTLFHLVATDAHINPTLGSALRLLLAVGAAAIGAALPGAVLNLGYEGRGLVLRTVGAAAFFALVWLGVPAKSASLAACAVATAQLR